MNYQGSCHCGRISFTADGTLEGALSCNCSICERKGSLLWFVPAERFTLTAKPDDLGSYTFNKHVINHHFCKVCGIAPYSEGADPKGNKVVAINIRCLENLDLASIPVQHFDGRKL
jgi:hypothetical protein